MVSGWARDMELAIFVQGGTKCVSVMAGKQSRETISFANGYIRTNA